MTDILTRESRARFAAPSATPAVQPVRVAVHLVELAKYLETADRLSMLSDGERERAERIAALPKGSAHVATRMLLRELLADRLGCSPAAVPLVREADGGARIACEGIEFSVTHADGWGAVALTTDCPVGVDVEPIRGLPGMADLMTEFLPPGARADFAAATPEQQPSVFFRWWTRIEAAVKASGRGLDHVSSVLDGVACESCDLVPGVALAVAARNRGRPLDVDWHVPDVARPAAGQLATRKDPATVSLPSS